MIAGRYQVQALLGQGSQGVTYRVFDLHQRELVALKLLKVIAFGDPWHEAAILTRLRDERILPVRNADFASGTPYVVTELAQHGTVYDKLATAGPAALEPHTAIRWIRQASQATARTHDARLLHTDIKPENLFLDEHQDVRLGDYGMASLIDSAGLGHCSGTATTMAPEVARAILNGNSRGTSVRSDVYSLGATLYWMLTGRPPFQPMAGTPFDPAAILANRPPRLRDLAPHVTQALAEKVEKAMSTDPAARYASAGEFAAVFGNLPTLAREWIRTDEHAGHLGCWRGTSRSSATILVCADRGPRRVQITAVKLPSARRIQNASFNVTMSQLAVTLRKIFRIVS